MVTVNLGGQAGAAEGPAVPLSGERPRHLGEVLEWMRHMLGEMSGAETVALSGIIAAALLLVWRARR